MTIQIIACFSLIITGSSDTLEHLARLIASTIQDVQIIATQYPVGWRLQIICKDEHITSSVYTMINQAVSDGLAVNIANGLEPMPTLLYGVAQSANS